MEKSDVRALAPMRHQRSEYSPLGKTKNGTPNEISNCLVNNSENQYCVRENK